MLCTRHLHLERRKSAAHVITVNRKDRLNDNFRIDSVKYAHLRALDPELPDHVWQVILHYKPQVSSVQWLAVREFTIANAVRMKPRTFETVRRLMTMSGRFNTWVWATNGGEPTVERIYTQNKAYLYLQACMPKHSEGHRWGVIRQLGHIADTLAETRIKPLPSLKRNPARRPFTLAEVATMHSWAGSLSTDLKRHNAWAILGLAGGAGLRTEEIIDVRIGDIEIADGRVFINVPGPRSRRVPVMHPWNRTLLRSIGHRTDPAESLFRGHRLEEYRPRSIQTFLTEHPSRVRATVSRLRSSWIVAQIDNRLPMPILMAIAGLNSAQSLDKYLVHAQAIEMTDYIGFINGEEVAR